MPGEKSAVQQRIDALMGLNDDADINENDVNLNPTDGGDNDGAQNETQEQAAAGEGAQRKDAQQPTDGQRDPGTGEQRPPQRGQEQRQPGKGAQQGQPAQRRLPANGQGDLVDPTTGAIIARAGNERRLFEHARTVAGQLAQTQSEVQRLQGQLETFQELQRMPQSLGLDVQEQHVAMQFMAAWKKNPVEAATKMLAEVRAMGYEVEGLATPVDMAALKKMVEDTIAPFRQDRDAVVREQEIAQTVDRELEDATQRFPWLMTQQDAVSRVLAADQSLSLREAALMVQSWAAQRGFDLHRPLNEQMNAAQQNGGQQAPQRPNAARNPPPTGNEALAPRRAGAAAHDRRSRDIVLESMREAGLNVDSLM